MKKLIKYYILYIGLFSITIFGQKEKRLLVIDLDTGIDDSFALLMAIKASQNPEFGIKILAITCVAGNTNITNCVRNTHRTLQVLGITNIPVYQGFDKQLVIPCVQDDFHGQDGLGDVNWPEEPEYDILEESAPSMMIKLAETYPGKGNVKVNAEYNFYCDPESASVVLNSYNVPITIVPLETCEDSYFTCDWKKNILNGLNTPEAQFLQIIEANLLESFYCPGPGNDGKYLTYDQITLAVLIEPNIILEQDEKYCTVELKGEYTRSMMVVDYAGHLDQNENVRIISKIDIDLYGDLLLWTLDENFRNSTYLHYNML